MYNHHCATRSLHFLYLQTLRIRFPFRHQLRPEDAKSTTLFPLVDAQVSLTTGSSFFFLSVTLVNH